ncbi:putative hydrolase [Maudiozyma humilis]|uniref:Hydrolase n=1 Tax=Maudiozyma humilis TaxID=51915 RepID=A0AAV5RS78_MAUHU|nr:putative hydrolase [Kazachstania humilis]
MTIQKQIKACLFDMDGLLINTEDIYTITCNEILEKYNKGPLTWDVKLQLQGLPGFEAGTKLLEHYGLPLTFEEFNKMNVASQDTKWPTCQFLPGALELIKYLHEHNIPIALCTSSNQTKFLAKTSHLTDGFDLFDAVTTGDDPRLANGRGKPCPDIWQIGLKKLNDKYGTSITPEECIVFEDGKPGVISGKAFGGSVVWVPHHDAYDHLGDVDAFLEGKGEMLHTLNDLDKAKYGL